MITIKIFFTHAYLGLTFQQQQISLSAVLPNSI